MAEVNRCGVSVCGLLRTGEASQSAWNTTMDNFGSALEKNVTDLTVMDVYDIAAVVGREFERIIDQYGCDALSRLMPKIVRVLEIVEILVSRNNISPETEELRLELERMRLDRKERLEKEKIREKELELVEDIWRRETQDLLSQISQLQAQNKTLRMSLSLKDSALCDEEPQQVQEGISEKERQMTRKLKEVVDQQKSEIKAKDRELIMKNEDVEALQLQQLRLVKVNQELRHRISVVEAQGKALIQQRAELEAQAQARQQELGTLKKELTRLREEHQEEAEEMYTRAKRGTSSNRSLVEVPTERKKSAAELSDMQNSVWVECGLDQEFSTELPGSPESLSLLRPHTDRAPGEEEALSASVNSHEDDNDDEDVTVLLWEALCDEDSGEDERSTPDPNRPRFTLQELRDVLQERNELKAQVFLLQEELAYYKSEEEQEEQISLMATAPSPPPRPPLNDQPDSGIRKLIFTAVMPMVAAGLISDDPTLQPIRRLISFV